MKLLRILSLSVLAWLSLSGATRAAPIYDVVADFSFINNPTGPWRYGHELTLGSPLLTYSAQSTVSGIQLWQATPGSNTTPNVAHNPTGGTITVNSTTFLPGQVSLHPGPLNQFSVIRFTVPTAGLYQLNSSFNMRSFGGTHSTDVHVLLNNNTAVQLYSGTVDNFNDLDTYNAFLTLAANDILDFVVGANGALPNQSFLGDTTQLSARLEFLPNGIPAPAPATPLLCLLGLSALGLMRRFKSQPE